MPNCVTDYIHFCFENIIPTREVHWFWLFIMSLKKGWSIHTLENILLVQQDAMHALPVCCSGHHLVCSHMLGQWHQSRRWQQTKQTDRERWTGHWDQSGLTEIRMLAKLMLTMNKVSHSHPPWTTKHTAEHLQLQTGPATVQHRAIQEVLQTHHYQTVQLNHSVLAVQ